MKPRERFISPRGSNTIEAAGRMHSPRCYCGNPHPAGYLFTLHRFRAAVLFSVMPEHNRCADYLSRAALNRKRLRPQGD